MARIVLDINLIYRLRGKTLTGIPRLERALFEFLSNEFAGDALFCIGKPFEKGFIPASNYFLKQLKCNKLPSSWDRLKNSLIKRLDAIKGAMGIRRSIAWAKGDCYLNVSHLWMTINQVDYKKFRQNTDLKIILFCHDFAPLLFPHFYSRSAHKKFSSSLGMLAKADLVICNSQSTLLDFQKLCIELGQEMPKVAIATLGANLSRDIEGVEVKNYNFNCEKFILVVGTVVARKNYELLCDLWETFADDDVMRHVDLVIVGDRGYGAESILNRIARDPKLVNRVFHLKDIQDSQLAWLYKHCLFTLYPSFYEGWGIPISESLAFNKLCIASSSSSMPEASQGLAIHLDPLDFVAWRSAIKFYVLDDDARYRAELKISNVYKREEWHEIASKIIELILSNKH
ncbi:MULTISPECIES: glycosyltransferase [unclassified Polynucleobacter]|jgi:glycosyltransferase involved in cell wall biosynthesis|uniref:glycosyltransferase n=1 Tax=unclassified Polynucleobacter TaxID=2640945 RepID=UPI0008BC8163|nr:MULTISPECIES: glycosyltransferase [unclassified Polynucleobacter]MBU3590407.1 glycosyltransferase [Polynucleobacter sp. 78F-HAINBA]MCX7237105.1 glycosyltransferase [Polynucleobacter sp.]OHC09431.1 MAG: hypothetical protein A2X74_06890 [Polynucleobacter sp. GWA2_45_21]HBK43103.1 hypothetical protein [Polynucleobacter sp.]